MIDTIKLLIPLTDQVVIKKLTGSLNRFQKKNMKDGRTEFEFFSDNIELGSHNRTVAIKSTNNPLGFFVEFSLPKYAKGNNVEMIHPHNVLKYTNSLYVEICKHMSYALPPISTWPIYRLDVCYNWMFTDNEEATRAIDFIKRIDFPRKKKYEWDTSVMYKGSAYTVKFYLKGAEFKKHDLRKIDYQKAILLQSWANKILRFEVGLKRKYLQDHFGLDKVFIHNIIDDKEVEDILKFYLDKTFFYINPIMTTNDEIVDTLRRKFTKGKATRLYQFYRGFYYDKEMKNMYLQGGLNRSTIYRYKKDLKQAGIGFVSENIPKGSSVLERLIIPSETTKFDLLDNDDYS